MMVLSGFLESMAEFRGLPRPTAPYGNRKLPMPWINGDEGDSDFLDFKEPRPVVSVRDRLCAICGNKMDGFVTLAAANNQRYTSGGWGHPRCIALAVKVCPHFQRYEQGGKGYENPTVAWLYRGEGVGLVDPNFEYFDEISSDAEPLTLIELKQLARDNPWGLEE